MDTTQSLKEIFGGFETTLVTTHREELRKAEEGLEATEKVLQQVHETEEHCVELARKSLDCSSNTLHREDARLFTLLAETARGIGIGSTLTGIKALGNWMAFDTMKRNYTYELETLPIRIQSFLRLLASRGVEDKVQEISMEYAPEQRTTLYLVNMILDQPSTNLREIITNAGFFGDRVNTNPAYTKSYENLWGRVSIFADTHEFARTRRECVELVEPKYKEVDVAQLIESAQGNKHFYAFYQNEPEDDRRAVLGFRHHVYGKEIEPLVRLFSECASGETFGVSDFTYYNDHRRYMGSGDHHLFRRVTRDGSRIDIKIDKDVLPVSIRMPDSYYASKPVGVQTHR